MIAFLFWVIAAGNGDGARRARGVENAVPLGSSTVEIDLVAEGTGTMLRFTHRDLPSSKSAENHTQGWEHYLGRLAVVAAGGDPGRDPWLDGPPME